MWRYELFGLKVHGVWKYATFGLKINEKEPINLRETRTEQ